MVVPLSASLRSGQSVAAKLTGIVAERMTETGKRVENSAECRNCKFSSAIVMLVSF